MFCFLFRRRPPYRGGTASGTRCTAFGRPPPRNGASGHLQQPKRRDPNPWDVIDDDVSGHERDTFGRAQIIQRLPTGVLWGGSDGRADGMAIGW